MITVRRSGDRRHVKRGSKDVWLTFFREAAAETLAGGFGALESLDESRLPPRAASRRHPQSEGDSVSYVKEGALAYVNSMGHSGVVHAGEFQRITAASQVHHRETNASHDEWVHVFRMGLGTTSGEHLEPSREEKRFSVAERRGVFCIVASLDARRGSLRLHQDVQVYSAVLYKGHHVVHELLPSRRAWIHVVQGAVVLGELVLRTGDGAGISGEAAVSATALMASELLLLDLEDEELESGDENDAA